MMPTMAGAHTEPMIHPGRKSLLLLCGVLLLATLIVAPLVYLGGVPFVVQILLGSIICTIFLIGFFIAAEKYGERVLYRLRLVSSRKSS